jgi:hypothetical protein
VDVEMCACGRGVLCPGSTCADVNSGTGVTLGDEDVCEKAIAASDDTYSFICMLRG